MSSSMVGLEQNPNLLLAKPVCENTTNCSNQMPRSLAINTKPCAFPPTPLALSRVRFQCQNCQRVLDVDSPSNLQGVVLCCQSTANLLYVHAACTKLQLKRAWPFSFNVLTARSARPLPHLRSSDVGLQSILQAHLLNILCNRHDPWFIVTRIKSNRSLVSFTELAPPSALQLMP